MGGKTQNQNESLNSMIWNRLPKSIFVGADVLDFGAYDAVAHFNIGSKAATKIFNETCFGARTIFSDKKRVKKADHRNTPAVKKRRKILRGQKRRKRTIQKRKRVLHTRQKHSEMVAIEY